MSARLTALKKADGGVRGIATGCTLRRLVARTLAKQFAKDFEEECAPFQYALSTRAGTDCVGHFLRAATDTDPQATTLSVDGIGAYDHVVSKERPSCPFFSQWASKTRWRKWLFPSTQENSCVPSKSHTPDVATESVTRVRRSPRRRHLEHSGRHHARFAGF